MARPRDYLQLMKPLQTALLMFTMFGALFAAGGSRVPLKTVVLLAVGGFLAIGGTTALNMYLETDIDALMPRTSRRPLPAGRVEPERVLAFSIVSYLLGVALIRLINPWTVFAVLMGFFFDIILYTDLAKRRTSLNIVLGGVAGGMPAFGGWTAYTGRPEAAAFLAALVVMAWIPMHIWFIATYYLDDYRRAGIPMLPVVKGERRAAVYIAFSIVLQVAAVAALYLVGAAGPATLLVAVVLGVAAIHRVWRFYLNPSRTAARRLFKVASPYLATIFLVMALEKVVGLA